MINIASALPTLPLRGTRVLLRADLNVPIHSTKIVNDYRLRALLPTLDFLLGQGAKVVLATHIGRPVSFSAHYSTSLLTDWFAQKGYRIDYCADLAQAYEKSFTDHDSILLLENLRFFPGEKNHDAHYARALAQLADYYVNDAFALLHRNDSSITDVPLLFAPDKRTIGFLIEQECAMLNKLMHHPQKPYVLVIGGGKVSDKLPVLWHLLDKVDTILLCPAIAFTFLKAQGQEVGKSLVDKTLVEESRRFLEAATKANVTLQLPLDYQIAYDTFNGPLGYCAADAFPEHAVGISIGPKTEQLFSSIINTAQTVFYNGLMGDANRPETLHGVAAIFKAMATANALTIIGGGDSVAAAQQLGYAADMSYLSTGGGATLEYLAGKELPGLWLLQI